MQIEYIFEMLGTIVFVGFVTAIGGGSLRDVLLGSYPLVWVNDVNFIYASFAGILLMRIFFTDFNKFRQEVLLFDAMGIALFTVLGTEKALELGNHPVIAAIMGMFTAVMGGVIRDTLTNETPVIFRKEIYATACLAGAVLFLVLNHFGLNRAANLIVSGSFIIIFRLLSIRYRWYIPKFNLRDDRVDK